MFGCTTSLPLIIVLLIVFNHVTEKSTKHIVNSFQISNPFLNIRISADQQCRSFVSNIQFKINVKPNRLCSSRKFGIKKHRNHVRLRHQHRISSFDYIDEQLHGKKRWRYPSSLSSKSSTILQSTTSLSLSATNENTKGMVTTSDNDDSTAGSILNKIQFLGTGPNAIVRPGVILLAPKDEYHHFYRNAAIFIFAIGIEERSDRRETDDNNNNDNSNDDDDDDDEYIIRGVILDHPTPFTVSEMILDDTGNNKERTNNELMKSISSNPLGQNLVFRGGETGNAGMILLHNQSPSDVSSDDNNNNSNSNNNMSDEIGTSGIYHGGWMNAIQSCSVLTNQAESNTYNYKAFFNYCEFTETELDSLLSQSRSSSSSSSVVDNTSTFDEYQWCSIEVVNDTSIVLSNDYDRGDCWSLLRNIVRQQQQQNQE
jgi:Uncharacterized ACR, COG1678